ncbi:MAG: retropepsin-like aspartic protease [Rhodanobacteraceae bacterium]
MHKFAALLVVLALWIVAAPARALEKPDFFAPRAGMNADTALYLDAWSGKANAVERLRTRLARTPAPANAYDDWSFLCDFDFHAARYSEAIPECKKAITLNPKGDDANTLAIVKLLAGQSAPRAHGSARVPVTKGVRVPVKAGAYDGTALADTGAQISVMMQSVAKAAHVKMLGASRDVGSTTATISGQIGLIPEVRIGGATMENIPVLVLPDAQLTIRSGKETVSLPFILSLYALADFGRVAWLDHDKWLALGNAAPSSFPDPVSMIWHPTGIAVPLDGPGGRRAAQFDSGADVSYLYESGTALLSDAERASIVKARRKIGGLGGIVEQEVRRVPSAHFTLAGQPLVLKNINIAPEPDTGEAARLGEDVLATYSAVVFDFRAMTFSVSR